MLRDRGKLCIVAEQGGNVMQEGFLELSMERVWNFLRGLKMVEGQPKLPERQLVMRERYLVRMDHGGLFIPAVGSRHSAPSSTVAPCSAPLSTRTRWRPSRRCAPPTRSRPS